MYRIKLLRKIERNRNSENIREIILRLKPDANENSENIKAEFYEKFIQRNL